MVSAVAAISGKIETGLSRRTHRGCVWPLTMTWRFRLVQGTGPGANTDRIFRPQVKYSF